MCLRGGCGSASVDNAVSFAGETLWLRWSCHEGWRTAGRAAPISVLTANALFVICEAPSYFRAYFQTPHLPRWYVSDIIHAHAKLTLSFNLILLSASCHFHVVLHHRETWQLYLLPLCVCTLDSSTLRSTSCVSHFTWQQVALNQFHSALIKPDPCLWAMLLSLPCGHTIPFQ